MLMVFSDEGGTHTIDITEATCFALFGVVKPTSPVDSNITLVAIQSRGTFHTTSSTDTAEFEKPVKNRTVVTDIVPTLFLGELIHVVWCHFGQEINVFIGMELCHFVLRSGFRSLEDWRVSNQRILGRNRLNSLT